MPAEPTAVHCVPIGQDTESSYPRDAMSFAPR